jgi:hypothetical protein
MQVRDLIEQLQRFDPRANVTVEARGSARNLESGMTINFQESCVIDEVVTAAGELVIIAIQ